MAEKLNSPGFGARMASGRSTPVPTTSTRAMREKFQEQQEQQEQLRELLSSWRVRAESDNPSEYLDMSEMIDALAAILDGE